MAKVTLSLLLVLDFESIIVAYVLVEMLILSQSNV